MLLGESNTLSAKLLAYTSLCLSVFECTDALWDPADAASIQEIEAVQAEQ